MTTNIPYGYKANPDNPKEWAVDEEAAKIVKRIFTLCMEGKGPSQIAALLEKEKVLNPTAYKQREGRKTPHQTPENEYRWHESTVAYILEHMEYTGCTVNFKTYTNSIWDKCSGHYIRAVVLEDLVWKHMKEVISFVSQYEAHFRVEMEQKLRLQSEETIKVYKKRLTQAEKRIGELDRLFIKIYEDNAKGNLSDERFAMMSKTYEDEQAQLKVEIVNLQKEVEVQERQIENLEQFIQRVRRYTTLTELTLYALRELVKAVYVEAPDKSSGKRKQKVHIEYDLVGYIPVDELIKAEQA